MSGFDWAQEAPRKLNASERATVDKAINRWYDHNVDDLHNFTPDRMADLICENGLVAYVVDGNFTICVLKYDQAIRVGVAKRNPGGFKREIIENALTGIRINLALKQEPDEWNPERAMTIALSRAARAEPVVFGESLEMQNA